MEEEDGPGAYRALAREQSGVLVLVEPCCGGGTVLSEGVEIIAVVCGATE